MALTPTFSSAHTELLSSEPAAGSSVTTWPAEISLTFDEELQSIGSEKSNFVVVNNAVGDQISADDEKLDGSTIKVSLDPNTIQGPVLVYYRVVSADGHPVEGEYKFNFGKTSVTAEGVQNTEKSKYPIGIYIASALFITTSLFFGIYAYRRRNHA
ncbi:MAG: copper resistance protein CopC [Actinobacteria bacterium]|nr:copper resistance protein CopC [Actinomycetota bacterium]